ncbi:hypothetical protein BGX33_004904 [Mortierella sp. NVP41]|nr:hypothetical protein BGX33_004904 [Mortierella sp. NVP41]
MNSPSAAPASLVRSTFGPRGIPYFEGTLESWMTFTTEQNTICWMVVHHLDKTTSKAALEQRLRNTNNTEWGPHAAQTMCDETRHFSTLINDGGTKTLGDLYDLTPKELVSKVMLEEKIFKTWCSGRVVLIGDAIPKLHLRGGQGSMAAIHDAVVLANLIYALPCTTTEEIEKVFSA